MKSKSIQAKSTEDLKQALQHSTAEGFTPTIAVLFISVKQDRKAICELFNSKKIDVFGATSCGEFTDSQQSEGEIAVLLLELAKEHYSIMFEDIGNGHLNDAVSRLSNSVLKQFTNPSLILCSTGINLKGEHFEGAKYNQYGLYRLQLDCIMYTRHTVHCKVCQRSISNYG